MAPNRFTSKAYLALYICVLVQHPANSYSLLKEAQCAHQVWGCFGNLKADYGLFRLCVWCGLGELFFGFLRPCSVTEGPQRQRVGGRARVKQENYHWPRLSTGTFHSKLNASEYEVKCDSSESRFATLTCTGVLKPFTPSKDRQLNLWLPMAR